MSIELSKRTIRFIDSWLTLRSKWLSWPGFTVAIAQQDEVVFHRAYGVADQATAVPLTTNHLLRAASHSKMFTATALLQLQEQGLLRIDDNITTYIPWLAEHPDTRWQIITLRQLLSHSAGVIRDGTVAGFWQGEAAFPDYATLQQQMMQTHLVCEPNTEFKYSNFGFALLGRVIVQVSGQSYAEYVTEHIIQPLGLSHTVPEYSPGLSMATGYSRMTLAQQRRAYPHLTTGVLQPAAGFCTTAHDLARFVAALRVGSGKLLRDATKREMQRRAWGYTNAPSTAMAYGLGVNVEQCADGTALIGHSGRFPGFVSRTWLRTRDHIVVSVMANARDAAPDDMARSILSIIDALGDEQQVCADLCRFEGRFTNQYNIYQVVATRHGLQLINPNMWQPFVAAESLEVVDDTTLRIVRGSHFNYYGEDITYDFDITGTPKAIAISGMQSVASCDGDVPPQFFDHA